MNQDINNLAIALTTKIYDALMIEVQEATKEVGAPAIPSWYNVRERIWQVISNSIMELHWQNEMSLERLKRSKMSPIDHEKETIYRMTRLMAEQIFDKKGECIKVWDYKTDYYQSTRYSMFVLKANALVKP